MRTSEADIQTANVIKWAANHLKSRHLRPFMEEYHPHRNDKTSLPSDEFRRLVDRMLERADAIGIGSIEGVGPESRQECVANALWYHVVPAMDRYCPTPFVERLQGCLAEFWTDLQQKSSTEQAMATA